MKNYRKNHTVRFYQAETRKVTTNGELEEKTVKVYRKYAKAGNPSVDAGFDPLTESLDVKAYIRQLSAEERNAAKALQDDSEIEVAVNKRNLIQDMYMEFPKEDKTYQIGAIDNFDFQGTEIKFRAKAVVPVTFDLVEYRRY